MSSVGEQLRTGGVFAGYRIVGEIARGGMGVVYRASELRPERTVALKVVAPQLAADPNFRDRFLQEAQAAASIEHPHVVPVLRVDEQDGVLFIVMRYVRGQDLHSVIGAEGRLEPRRAARIVDQISDALDSAHERGLVHRDVKPANILIEQHRRGDHAYLTDFGLAKGLAAAGRLTSTGVVVGTTDYMAPEQWAGGRLDARVDVYSLGCVLYESLTGEVPYAREGHAARMYAHLNAPPPHAREAIPEVSVALDAVVIRALAKTPDDRYPSAGDLGLAAVAAADGRPVDRPERSVAIGEAAPTRLASTPVHDDAAPTSPPRTTSAAPPVPSSDTPRPPVGRPPLHRSRWLAAGGVAAVAAVIVGGLAVAGVLSPGSPAPTSARTITNHSSATSSSTTTATATTGAQAATSDAAFISCSAPGLAEGHIALPFTASGVGCAEGSGLLKEILGSIYPACHIVAGQPPAPSCEVAGLTCTVQSNNSAPGSPVLCKSSGEAVRFTLPG